MLPLTIYPMLAAKAEGPFDSEEHLFEIKWDGIRCLAFIEHGRARLQTRRLTEITAQFPELAVLARLPSGTVVDGELVVLQSGKPSLEQIQKRALLQNRARIQHLSHTAPATYVVFDLLFLKDRSLLAAPLNERREALNKLHAQMPSSGFLLSEAIVRSGCALYPNVLRLGLEGMMAKRLDAPYLPGKRSRLWLKIKPAVMHKPCVLSQVRSSQAPRRPVTLVVDLLWLVEHQKEQPAH
jgi:bifunctional non-homologous end joining protein LigD